jgi:hypothetical protein
VLGVGIEVDAGDVAGAPGPALVALEEEMSPVVVAGIGAVEAMLEDEVGVLVGLGLVRLGSGVGGNRNHLRIAGRVEDVVVVAIERGEGRGILEPGGTLGDRELIQLG